MAGATSRRRRPTSRPWPALSVALSYRNRHVLNKFRDQYDVTEAEAQDIFTECKKYLWLCGQVRFAIPPQLIIDEMWHTFVLFTKQYQEYCFATYGSFLHHVPTTWGQIDRERREFERDPEGRRRKDERRMRRQIRAIHRLLGEPTLLKWLVDYTQRYGDDFFHSDRVKRPPRRGVVPSEWLQSRYAELAGSGMG